MEQGRRGRDLGSRRALYAGRCILPLLLGLTACGNPSQDAPLSGRATGSADAKVGEAARVGASTTDPASPALTQTSPFEPIARPVSTPGTFSTVNPRATQPALPPNTPSLDEKIIAEQAQRAARHSWYAEMLEHPDATVRLQALELWAQHPGEALDPVTHALVDGDESVRARAQELWEQHLQGEPTTTQPAQETAPGGQIKR